MRRDGKKVKVESVEYALTPHIMPQRNDSLNFIEVDIPLQPMQDYLNAKRKEGKRISHLALIVAAYVRVLGQFPQMNRFIVNKKVYARNELNVGMVVLKAGQMDNGTMSKVNFDPADTIDDVNRKMTEYIESNRGEGDNSTDKLAKFLVSVPGLMRFGVNLFRWADKHGLLPRAIIDASPFHTSMSITNLASIRTNHIFHHIYNFGTTGVFIAMGNSREVPKRKTDGEIYFEKCIPLGIVMDERICSGSYFALAFRQFRKYLTNPELLEVRPDEKDVIRETKYRKDKYPED
ncbi:MAG: 2-oxo acid dehydrogenase subunit E2 [Clostridia bacterium]|nr:2-oxo acid dehydrogenase subunit E2 [Clostridia bacterium]